MRRRTDRDRSYAHQVSLAAPEHGARSATPRRAPGHLWLGIGLLILWGGLVLIALIISISTGNDIQLCTFRRVTGFPCPTCGSTRVVYSLAQGHVLTALEINPFTSLLILVAPVAAAWIYVTRRTRPRLTQRAHTIIVGVVLALLVANWWYITRPGSLVQQPTSALAERWKQKAGAVDRPLAD
jgi:glucan phosphoethanolaminetransferase (alkaline phosphatase superfamily)